MAYDYCLLLTAKCDPNGVGEFEQGADAPKWVSPNDPEFTANDPNVLGPSLTPKAGDRVTFAVKIENLSGGDPNDPNLEFKLVAVISAKPVPGTDASTMQANHNSPFRFPGTNTVQIMKIGSFGPNAGFAKPLCLFDASGNQGQGAYSGFDYAECVLFHSDDRTDLSKFEVTLSAWAHFKNPDADYQWAYDPEMDVGKRGSK